MPDGIDRSGVQRTRPRHMDRSTVRTPSAAAMVIGDVRGEQSLSQADLSRDEHDQLAAQRLVPHVVIPSGPGAVISDVALPRR